MGAPSGPTTPATTHGRPISNLLPAPLFFLTFQIWLSQHQNASLPSLMLTGDAVISDRTSFCICVQHNAGSLSPCMVSFSCRCTTTALYFGFWFQILLDFVTFEPFWPCTCHIRVQFPDFCGPWRVVNYFPSKMTFLVDNNYLGLPFLHLRTIADDLTSRRAPSRYIENNTGNRESSCWVPIVVSKLCDKGLPTPIERDVLASSK